MNKLKGILDQGLEKTARLWPEVRKGFALVQQAAQILQNGAQGNGVAVRRHYLQHLQRIRQRARHATPVLREHLEHFLKVTDSYLPGLFHCYDLPQLPRTNNALEQFFGSTRHHERRCTGRKAASPSLVLRGAVRVVAAVGTRQRLYRGAELAPHTLEAWHQLRRDLDQRRAARILRYRFRRDPAAYLRQLEEILLKSTLPP